MYTNKKVTLSNREYEVIGEVIALKNKGYGLNILERLSEKGKPSYGSIYKALKYLTKNGYVIKTKETKTCIRSGQYRYYYEATPKGLKTFYEEKVKKE